MDKDFQTNLLMIYPDIECGLIPQPETGPADDCIFDHFPLSLYTRISKIIQFQTGNTLK